MLIFVKFNLEAYFSGLINLFFRQDPPREAPKAPLPLTFFKILPNFNLVRKFWNETARVPPIIMTFPKFTL